MSYTSRYTATQGAWLKVAEGVIRAFLQLQDGGPVKVVVSPVPPSNTSFDGVEMDSRGVMEMVIDGMEPRDAVYIRSRHDESNEVVVVAPGVPPV